MSDREKELEFIDIEAGEKTPANRNLSPRSRAASAAPTVTDSPRSSASLLSDATYAVRKAKHPVAAMFHLLFKILALIIYILGGFVSNSFVFVFVICVLLLAFDFWTVKNVSGRLLVGLRWWNRINEDGTNEWIFESHEDMNDIDPLDAKVFWTGLYGAPIVWALLLIIGVLKFNIEWALIATVALVLSGANIVGYTKCRKDAKDKMRNMMAAGAFEALNSSAGSTILSTISSLAFNVGSSSKSSQQNNPSVTV